MLVLVTAVLLIVPVTLLITEALKVSAYPYPFGEIFAANIGGTATLNSLDEDFSSLHC